MKLSVKMVLLFSVMMLAGLLILSSYAYDDDGRYSFLNAYTPAGQFLRCVAEKVRE